MKTKIIRLNSRHQEKEKIQEAAQVLQQGGIVAFPTETVYGLGARLTDRAALKKIFSAKKRPADNPLIVHVADYADLADIAEATPLAKKLMKKFWPGPLTLVLKKKPMVPDLATAGLKSVAVRMPSHPVALALIKATGEPIAAPSANLAGRPSPTTAEHVYHDLKGRVPLILDAGETTVGLESTVMDLTHTPPAILRPGAVTFEELKKVMPNLHPHPFRGVARQFICRKKKAGDKPPRYLNQQKETPLAPGMKYRHYAPQAKLTLVMPGITKVIARERERPKQSRRYTESAGIASPAKIFKKNLGRLAMTHNKNTAILDLRQEKNLKKVARRLFASLRSLDQKGVKNIIVYGVPEKGIGDAIMNRLRKAASRIIE